MITLPGIDDLKWITQSLATLDLILCREWEDRYYSYDSKWADHEEMASMRNGCGDDWFILFDGRGFAGIKGLAHESPAARDPNLVGHIRRVLPGELAEFANEPAFHWDSTSFCYWRLPGDAVWSEAPEQVSAETGAEEFLGILANPATGYLQFASEYYERDLHPSVIDHILSHRPLTPELISYLNPGIGMDEIREDLEQVRYPAR
ncbi:MAG: hypothetical protein HKN23_19060 [Verrucomicrobiales bacterium]|nr:hypothetical protein [Verrucomicrobiales bacterium]